MDWQQQIDFLHAWPELHSLLAAYLAIEEDGEQAAIAQFVAENPHAVARVKTQLTQLIQSENQAFYQQAAKLAGAPHANQAWLQNLFNQLD
jgi:hypothetical protein